MLLVVQILSLANGWRQPSDFSAAYLEVTAHGDSIACDFPEEPSVGDDLLPAKVPQVVTAKQRARYEVKELLAQQGAKTVEFGLSESRLTLADFVDRMQHETSSNASFIVSSDIGASDLPLRGAPQTLAGGAHLLTIASDGAGLELHTHGASYLALLHGHLLWVAAPPGALLPSWLLDAHGHALANQLGRLRKLPYDDAKSYVITCTQQPGTAVYLPEGWSRATVSLGDTVALVQQHQQHQQRQKEAAGLLQGSS